MTIGPLNRQRFNSLLPGTTGAGVIEQLIRTYAGSGARLRSAVILKASDVPACPAGGVVGREFESPESWLDDMAGKGHDTSGFGDAVFRFFGNSVFVLSSPNSVFESIQRSLIFLRGFENSWLRSV